MAKLPQIVIDGEVIAGRHPWLFTAMYCIAIGMLCSLIKSLTGWEVNTTTVLVVAALHMAVEARFGGRRDERN